ncbi:MULTISPECIES: phage head-tail connector protein [Bhargavaea]|uniref:Phage head-tail connector protein n=1 Tax=Bhargavaea changchunensis TaxID=2134037 RepID=A0ABW2NF60_9BACL|nr:phage head-tail connector protein [Bhargavaea sp. CC-171006]
MDKNQILMRVRTLLDIKDGLQDDALEEIVGSRIEHLKLELESDTVPEALSFIIVELAVRRFNRLGSEGMKGESVEGHSVNFYGLEDEFKPYQRLIDRFRPKTQHPPGRGKVFFL